MPDIVRNRVHVTGIVQGVGFRWSAKDEAERLGLVGFVRNLADASVEAEFEGTNGAVEAMVDWMRSGPKYAQVDQCTVSTIPVQHSPGFLILA